MHLYLSVYVKYLDLSCDSQLEKKEFTALSS